MDINEFAKTHKAGYLEVPKDLDVLPSLAFGGTKFVAPCTVDLRDYCTRTEDQGSKPWCAAYSAAGFAENVLWRINDYPSQIDPSGIYKYAKTIDGDPHGDGTTLTAVLEALLKDGVFDRSVCSIKVIRADREKVKYAIHKFGCCLGGFNITSEWYELNERKTAITGDHGEELGGHAVLLCGYNDAGVIFQNSWGEGWGAYGYGLITWDAFDRQFMYGAVLDNCLNGMKMN